MHKILLLAAIYLFGLACVQAEEDNLQFIQEYLDFVEYADGTISSEQLNSIDINGIVFIDSRNAGQFNEGHIPGAINIDWRETLTRIDEIPRDKPVILYCETGLLSSKAHFMLRLAGYNNVKVLWGGYLVWSAQQSFEDAALVKKK
ncbi:MAG: rhodanese-like domain-containing protein [Gammaproteobacteria bacterium]|jgi:rhodanese-related sulfurtransferase